MSAYGISGFVDGFLKGRQIRMDNEDRKDAKERQKRLDDLTFTQDARAAEEHAKRMGVYDREASAAERALAEDEARRETLKRAYDAATESYGAEPQAPADPVPSVSLPLAPPRDYARDAMIGPGGIALPSGGGSGSDGGAGPGPAAAAAQAVPRGLGAVGGGGGADSGQASQVQPPAPHGLGATAGGNDPMAAARVKRLPNGNLVAPAPSPAIADELYRQGPVGVRYLRTDAENAMIPGTKQYAAAKDTAAKDAAVEAETDAMEIERLRRVAFEDGPIPIQWRQEAAKSLQEKGYVPVDGGKSVQKAGATAPAAEPVKGAVEYPDAPGMQPGPTKDRAKLIGVAKEAMAEAATPALAAAAQAAAIADPKAMGVKPGEKVTEKQKSKAATSFIDHYMEVGAPMVIEDMIRRGDFKGATEFQTWMDSQAARSGMKSWAKAAFAASIGDMETFADEVVTAYNRLDYFPDGTTIVKEASGFTYGKGGEINGARLTFMDEASGNTFEQVFESPDDLVRMGITLLSPEVAYQKYAEQVSASKPDRLSLKDSMDLAQEEEKRIDGIAKTIFEAGKDAALTGGEPITYEQARLQAEMMVRGNGLGSLGAGLDAPPPVMRRPGN